ncbi:MAG: GNAT family N-acetyltransferase [Velocimicrobium sp.]
MLSEYDFVFTNGDNTDFEMLCHMLDENLDELVGKQFQREIYKKYNRRDSIHDVILIYHKNVAIACGAFKKFDEKQAELKRVFLKQEFRGKGLATLLISQLEQAAREKGFDTMILETGEPLVAATKRYEKLGYHRISNYGQYVDMPNSICMSKLLKEQ